MTRSLSLAALLLLTAVSCGTDTEIPEGPPPSEHGRWGVTQAFRDGRETHMIDVAYFEFDTATQELTTNFTGEETTLGYRRDDRGIETPDNRFFERMNFETLTDSTLEVSAEVSGYYFRIALAPQTQRIDRTLVEPE